MAIESTGHSRGNPRLYELVEHAPKEGKSPTIWAWPEIIDYLKVAGQPVPGPWPPHQQPRPDPGDESLPVAIAEPAPVAAAGAVPPPAAPAPASAPRPAGPSTAVGVQAAAGSAAAPGQRTGSVVFGPDAVPPPDR